MSWNKLFFAAICLCGLLATLRADDKSPSDSAVKPSAENDEPAALFAQLDVNKDGQLSTDEVPQEKKRLFERLLRIADKDHDGKLTGAEFSAGFERKEPPAAANAENPAASMFFDRLDANGDGKVTLDEVPEPRRERFKRLIERGDKDGDGALSRQEMAQAFRGGTEDTPPQKKPGEANPPESGPGRFFQRLDKNGDGKITKDEVPEERQAMFARIFQRADKDGDGALTIEELTAGMRERAGQAGPPPQFAGRSAKSSADVSLFRALDADHDGKLSGSEISASPEVIRKLDANGDGDVTEDEFAASRATGANDKSEK